MEVFLSHPHRHRESLRARLWTRPTWRVALAHAWPWLAVAGLYAAAGCWWGLTFPLGIVVVVAAVWLARR